MYDYVGLLVAKFIFFKEIFADKVRKKCAKQNNDLGNHKIVKDFLSSGIYF